METTDEMTGAIRLDRMFGLPSPLPDYDRCNFQSFWSAIRAGTVVKHFEKMNLTRESVFGP